MSSFTLLPGYCRDLFFAFPTYWFKNCPRNQGISFLYLKMHIPCHNLMGKQISVKYFNSFQGLKCQVKSQHMLRICWEYWSLARPVRKWCQSEAFSGGKEGGRSVFGWLIRIAITPGLSGEGGGGHQRRLEETRLPLWLRVDCAK